METKFSKGRPVQRSATPRKNCPVWHAAAQGRHVNAEEQGAMRTALAEAHGMKSVAKLGIRTKLLANRTHLKIGEASDDMARASDDMARASDDSAAVRTWSFALPQNP